MREQDIYYLIGYPANHSLSPTIHNEFARQSNQNMRYEILEIAPKDLYQTLEKIKENRLVKGLSVTLPYKEKLYHYCDNLDALAEQAKAVSNIIINEEREFFGLNLDGVGLVTDLTQNFESVLQNKKILVLGAGGAVKGILGALIQAQPKQIVIANRTFEKAQKLVESIHPLPVAISAQRMDEITGQYDLVINATSASASGHSLPVSLEMFAENAFGYDLMYGDKGTVFTKWCQKNNIPSADGKGMLMELSKIIFYRWTGNKV